MDPPRRERRGVRISERTAEQVADAMFALSSSSRVQILGYLLDGPRTVGEIVDAVEMEQSAVSHQLRVLRDHSLVRVSREGRRRVYAIHDDEVAELLEAALGHVERRHSRTGGRAKATGEAVG